MLAPVPSMNVETQSEVVAIGRSKYILRKANLHGVELVAKCPMTGFCAANIIRPSAVEVQGVWRHPSAVAARRDNRVVAAPPYLTTGSSMLQGGAPFCDKTKALPAMGSAIGRSKYILRKANLHSVELVAKCPMTGFCAANIIRPSAGEVQGV